MEKKTHSEEWLRDFLKTAKDRFERAITAESENRAMALDDLKFKAGDQWYPQARADRTQQRRPCLTINKMKTFCHQITNDLRQNRPAIGVSPVGEKADKHTATVLKGLIREIVRRSSGDIAFDTGIDGAVSNGFGYWRIITEYEDEDSFDQVISVLRVRNPFTVYMDPDRQQPDGSDAMWAFVTEMIPRTEYERRWPKADKMAWQATGIGDEYRNWMEEKSVRIAEYFDIAVKRRTLVHLANGFIGFKDALTDELKERIKADPEFVLKERESECRTITWYKITGKEILEEREWAGRWIPIIECVGDEIDIEGKVIKSGIIRDAKDPQRMKNYWNHGCLNTPVPTPSGWKNLGEIHAGDKVFDEDGAICNVVGESPTFLFKDCYKVTFQDGCEIVASGEHQWRVEERGKRKTDGIPLTTKTVCTTELDPLRHFIKTAKPLDLPESHLPIHPYVLGHWLSDGDAGCPQITPGDEDIDEVRSIFMGLGADAGRIRRYGESHGRFTVHGINSSLRELGLVRNKHIPREYLRASREQRLELLRGFMDSDGSITKHNKQCSYTTITQALAEGFAELVASLGIKATSIKRSRGAISFPQGVCDTKPFWQFSFCAGPDDDLFRLQRKRAVQNDGRRCYPKRTKRHEIKSIERVRSVPVKCIAVDSKNNLFLWGRSMIPTHNTAMTERVALETKAPWVMAEGQVEGHEAEWRDSNITSRAYITYKPTSLEGKLVPAPMRQAWGGPPAGVMAAEAGAEQDMMATTGIRFDATKSERISDESGIALKQLNSNQQLGAYHYTDNYGRSLTHTGRVILDLVCPIYDTKRILTIVNDDGTDETVMIDPNQTSSFGDAEHEGKNVKCINPMFGKFEVAVTIGPNYQTRMQEASDGMLTFGKNFPNTAPYIADLVAKNQNWPESNVISDRLMRLLPPELLAPNAKELTPQVQALLTSMKRQIDQLQQERQQMMAELQSKEADRAVLTYKADKNYEIGLTKIAADLQIAMGDLMDQKLSRIFDSVHQLEMQNRDLAAQQQIAAQDRAAQAQAPAE